MVLAWQMTDHSGPRIGHFFGDRDHTTVLHARRSVQKRRESDPKLDRAVKRIALELVR
jgi:chromosomal replication initiator protein